MIWAAWNGREICMRKLLDHEANPEVNDLSHIQSDI